MNVSGECDISFDVLKESNCYDGKARVDYKGEAVIIINYQISIKKQTNSYKMLDVYKFGKEQVIPAYNAKSYREQIKEMIETSDGGESPAKPTKPVEAPKQNQPKEAPKPQPQAPKPAPAKLDFIFLDSKEHEKLGQAAANKNFSAKLVKPLTADDVQNYENKVLCVDYCKVVEDVMTKKGTNYMMEGDFPSGKRIKNMGQEVALWASQIQRALQNGDVSPKDYLSMVELNTMKNAGLMKFFGEVKFVKGLKLCTDRHPMFLAELKVFQDVVKNM